MFKKNRSVSLTPDIKYIYQFGDQIALNKTIIASALLKELEGYKEQWTQHNPRKPHIKRYGLSVLNHTGEIGPGPALDSLGEYNAIHKTNFRERDFDKPTPVWTKSKLLPGLLEGVFPYCVRTHFLKLSPGGFFPPHRDHNYGEQTSFRMLLPIQNMNPPYFYFMIEEKPLYFNYGRLYVLNTTKYHSLCNISTYEESIMLVITVRLCRESIDYVRTKLLQH